MSQTKQETILRLRGGHVGYSENLATALQFLFGGYFWTNSDISTKRWVLVVLCLSSRAVHLLTSAPDADNKFDAVCNF